MKEFGKVVVPVKATFGKPVVEEEFKEYGTVVQPAPQKMQEFGRIVKPTPNTTLSVEGTYYGTPEQEKEAWDNYSGFHKTIDILSRLGYGVKAAVAEVQEQSPYVEIGIEDGKFKVEGKKGRKEFDLSEIPKAYWQGLTGKKRVTANQLWARAGVRNVPGLGFVTEVASDWAGGGDLALKGAATLVKGGLKGTQLGYQVARKIPAFNMVASRIDETAQGLKSLFVNKTNLDGLNKIIERGLGERAYRKVKEVRFAKKTNSVISNISKSTGRTIDDVQTQIINLIENPELVPANTPKESILLANTLRHRYDRYLIDEINAGAKVAKLGSGVEARTAMLRTKLNAIRESKITQLTSARDIAIKELDELSKAKIARIEAGLVSESEAIQSRMFIKNKVMVESYTQKIKEVEQQGDIYKKWYLDAVRRGNPTGKLENKLLRLENDYWYYSGRLADRMQDIPELTQKNSSYLNRIKEIETILTETGIEADLGRSGLAKAKNIYKIDKQLSKGVLPEGKRAGKMLMELSDIRAQRELGYYPRIVTAEAKKYLDAARKYKLGNRQWNIKIDNAKKRLTADMTIDEFNALVREEGLDILGGEAVEEFFSKNPAYATAIRGIRNAKTVTSANFLNDVGKIYGLREAPMHWVELPQNITTFMPELKGMMFDPRVADEIVKVNKNYFNPQEIQGVMKMFDNVQDYWKKWTLAPFPKYHLRNAVGNIWNNYLADVKNPVDYGKAQAIQMWGKYRYANGIKKEAALKNLGLFNINRYDADKIIANAERTGVLESGWFGADIETAIEKQLMRKTGKDVVKEIVTGEKGIETGLAIGKTIENNARLAHFINKINLGLSIDDAAKSVKKYLFDYKDLTPFEKQVMKRVFPFYTWTRKNIPLQLETLVQEPQKYAQLLPLLRDRNPKDLLKLKYVRPDLYDRLPVEFRRDADSVTYIPLEGIIPAGDLAKIGTPEQAQDLMLEMLSPYLRVPIELKFNKSFYFDSEIQRYDNETQELLRMDIPVKTKYLLTTILPQARLLNEIDKIVRKKIKKEELTASEKVLSQTLSSIYKTSLEELNSRAKYNLKKKIDELIKGGRSSVYKLRPKESERIKKTISEIVKIAENMND